MTASGLKVGGWVAGTKWTRTITHVVGRIHRGRVVGVKISRMKQK